VRAFLRPSAGQHVDDVAEKVALTPAEREVLLLLTQGLDNRAIAARLGKSEKTVRNQFSTIFSKLGVRTRAEAIVMSGRQRDEI
jgi:DNA-binding NarL/FixJ family response regulator